MSPVSRMAMSRRYFALMTLGALGVVYGDIGTSPLYAMRECFHGPHAIDPSESHVYGILSLIIWSLLLVVSVKYLLLVLRADNNGEGGVLALIALLVPPRARGTIRNRRTLVAIGLIGTGLLYGDGIITAAISVLSAVEGLKVAAPAIEPYIVSITLVVLSALYIVQQHGTASIGIVFGPIIVVWFTVLGLLGISSIIHTPQILHAINPYYGFAFLAEYKLQSLYSLGSVFLAITGAEALYADMGHFGRKPIRWGWFGIVFWGLLLNYLGQGALILRDPSTVENPFYKLAPSWGIYPLIALATAATVIASQAVISGVFSMTRQAVQLGYLPRILIKHTSSREIGQIFVPRINHLLWFATILLVLMFQSSSNLAAAYGIAVSTSMLTTLVLLSIVAIRLWKVNQWLVWILAGFFFVVDSVFFASNMLKVFDGGWVPILIGVVVFIIMSTWYRGREILSARLEELTDPLTQFLADSRTNQAIRVPGTAIFMSRNVDRAPPALVHNVKHNKVIHKTTIFLQVQTWEIPLVSEAERLEIQDLGDGFYRMTLHYGFMEIPDVPETLSRHKRELHLNVPEITFFFGKETLLPTDRPGMAIWREKLFAVMTRNAQQATSFFKIQPEQVIEIGFQVEI